MLISYYLMSILQVTASIAAFKHALTALDQYILCSEYRRVHGVLGLPLGTGPALLLPFNEVAA